ncbi:MAG TPA: Gfo/Idh/MocA family oxidoreductase, partial [Gemmatimonadales bacterium]|nr:Gfo/Idh/MocA family oxidoreductase [Gemmatimonadales bacterium]
TDPSRRDFLQTSALAAAGLAARPLSAPAMVRPGNADPIRVGVIGCGGRGTGAARDCVTSSPNIEIVAMGDLFDDRLDQSKQELRQHIPAAFKVTPERTFSGFDAYRGVLEAGVDLVILASPPAFRPDHLAAAVAAGKHIFTEKPVAVCPTGIRAVLEAAGLSEQKGLAVVAGTQRRHDPLYQLAIARIREGAMGPVLGGQVYWNQGGLWKFDRASGMSDVEWQIRNWLYYTWTSGDHIVEQHVHNLDVANWVLGALPVRATGMGGRQVRVDPAYGHIFDHFAVEFEYPGGQRILSMCRQQDGTSRFVGERFTGADGTSDARTFIRGRQPWRAPSSDVNPYVQEHTDLIASIRAGSPLNELRQVAESTLTAIMGREAAYTGQQLGWEDVLNSELDLLPGDLAFGDRPVAPVPVPGVTQLARPPFGHARATAAGAPRP